MRILWVGDAACSTGFARCTHAACDELEDRGHEVHVLGMNYFGDPHDYPYPIYPCLNLSDGGKDLFGEYRLPRMIKRVEPDAVVILQDPWNIPQYLERIRLELGGINTPFREIDLPKIIGWLAVDAKNQPAEALNYLSHVVTWTKFGLDELVKGGYTGTGGVVPLGVDRELFAPMDRLESRDKVVPEKVPRDAFIVGVVGRNQPRKRLDLTIEYFAEWVDEFGHENCWLYLHVAPTGDVGCNLDLVSKYHKIAHRLIKATPVVGVGAPSELMPYLYSAFDLYWTTTSGEGWGLPTLEAMACGTPTLVPNWSALGEWPKDASYAVPCTSTQLNAPMNDQAFTIGGVPDKVATVEALQRLWESADLRNDLAEKGLGLAKEYTWAAAGAAMSDEIERIAGLPKNVVSIAEKRDSRG